MMEGGHAFGRLPDHLLVEIFVRVPFCEWSQISCVNKHWAEMFRGESLWQTAIIRSWPFAVQRARSPGPIPRGFGIRDLPLRPLLLFCLFWISFTLPSNYGLRPLIDVLKMWLETK
ncbi:FBOX [Musa troglodytarum]|uniref:FBOX n=1 Tax=Musa troglodytarum TaxID=320322 RepID=A0A9E7H4E7_9LILI|nr:FBOX [Musa troglodytarum]